MVDTYTAKADGPAWNPHKAHPIRVTIVHTCPKCSRPTYETHEDGTHGCFWSACMHRKET